MEFDDEVKLASQQLSEAVNVSAQESGAVREAIRRLREMGYEPRLTFQLELAAVPAIEGGSGADDTIEEDFTEDDRRALRRMLIRAK